MPPTQLANRILLCSVAFGVSSILGLLANRDFQKALLTGVITVPAAYAGTAIADNRRIKQEKLLRNSLQNQIEALEEEEIQLYQSLSAATTTRQDVEASINALQAERSQLLGRVSELHHQRNELYRELSDCQKLKQQQETELYTIQNQILQFEKQQTDLSQSLAAKIAQIQQTEIRYNRLQTEFDQLKNQVSDQQNQQEHFNQELAALERRKQHLGGEAYDLQTQIKVLEQRRSELNQALLLLKVQQQQVQSSLTSGQAKLKQLQRQISAQQEQQEQLNQTLVTLEHRKQHLETESRELQTQIQALDKQKNALPPASSNKIESKLATLISAEWLEWIEFVQYLSEDEKIALKAILERDEATLKKIATEKLTMPQVLVNSINHQFLEKFDDILFFSRSTSVIPEINDEYLHIFEEPITIYCTDLLNSTNKQIQRLPQAREMLRLPPASVGIIVPTKTKTWCCTHTLEHAANSVIISPNRKMLISGGRDGKIKLWDLETGELLNILAGHTSSVESIAISSDSQLLASSSSDTTIKLWNLNTGKLLHTFTGHSGVVSSVALSPDSQILASGSYDKSIKLWDVTTKKPIRTLQGVSSLVSSIVFSPRTDQKILTAGLVEGRVLQWGLEKDSWPSTLLWNTQKVESLAISSDCKTLIIGDGRGGIKVVKLDMGVEFSSVSSHQGSVASVVISPDSKTFLSAGNDIRLWNIESRELMETFSEHSAKVCSVAFSFSGDNFASSSQDGTIKIWQSE